MLSSTPGGAIGDPLSATNTREPSRLRRTPRGRLPTGMVATTFCVATSITLRSPPFSLLTKSRPAVGGGTGAAGGAAAGAVDDEGCSGAEHARRERHNHNPSNSLHAHGQHSLVWCRIVA